MISFNVSSSTTASARTVPVYTSVESSTGLDSILAPFQDEAVPYVISAYARNLLVEGTTAFVLGLSDQRIAGLGRRDRYRADKRSVHESLERSLKEHARVWEQLSKY